MGGQGFDDATVGDRATPALTDDVAQFLGEPGQVGELALDLGEMRAGDGVDLGAGSVSVIGKGKELPDLIDREAQIPPTPDEAQAA